MRKMQNIREKKHQQLDAFVKLHLNMVKMTTCRMFDAGEQKLKEDFHINARQKPRSIKRYNVFISVVLTLLHLVILQFNVFSLALLFLFLA